jgi:hypothetical protein
MIYVSIQSHACQHVLFVSGTIIISGLNVGILREHGLFAAQPRLLETALRKAGQVL